MDFQELLNIAQYNSNEAKSESSVKRYSTVLPPPKKPDKSTVQSDSIRRFLAKRKAEEAAKAEEARKQKEKLLELRSQNTKNNKKAKIMASRTKDNDFSRIKLSEDEIISKKKIEMELQRKHLMDKKERMKVRIELEEKEKLLPRKRKRKSKHGEKEDGSLEDAHEEQFEENPPEKFKEDRNNLKNGVRKPPRPPPPTMSFSELLKVAEKKMHEPVVIPKKKAEEERPMTKKERKLAEEERERLRRKQERLEKGIEPSLYQKPSKIKQEDSKAVTKNPHIVQVEKDRTVNGVSNTSKFKIPKSSANQSSSIEKNKVVVNGVSKLPQPSKTSSSSTKELPKSQIKKEPTILSKKPSLPNSSVPKKVISKVKPVVESSRPKSPETPNLDTDALTADIERRVREKLEKQLAEKVQKQLAAEIEKKVQEKLEIEMAEKYRITLEEQRKKLNLENQTVNKVNKSEVTKVNSKIVPKPVTEKILPKKLPEKVSNVKKDITQKNSVPKPPPKKAFHANPYLDPPRRRLEPLIPPKKRQIIEDDDDDEDEDDMSDFIDDGPSVEDENYSQYIKQIFGYDRSKYIDEDDDDIVETSYVEQMKEEMKSARQGYLEDLEEERKQRKEEMEKKKKKMKLIK